jgi:hypothetical protein
MKDKVEQVLTKVEISVHERDTKCEEGSYIGGGPAIARQRVRQHFLLENGLELKSRTGRQRENLQTEKTADGAQETTRPSHQFAFVFVPFG